MASTTSNAALRRRLLQDIYELQTKPYSNITFVSHEDDLTQACLIVTPNGDTPLHMTIKFGSDYPLRPPTVTMQSEIFHPNVMGSYICASILNTTEGYTPAYTLKGIAIQLLSFFGSDSLEQSRGGKADLSSFRKYGDVSSHRQYGSRCSSCGFNGTIEGCRPEIARLIRAGMSKGLKAGLFASVPGSSPEEQQHHQHHTKTSSTSARRRRKRYDKQPIGNYNKPLDTLPDEILVLICNKLETEELMTFARAWNKIGGEGGIMTKFNLIRNRELICFCLKQSFERTKLGVGVHVAFKGRQGSFESEFDLLSMQAFQEFKIRVSVQGLPFENWLPLPISRKHYTSIRDEIKPRLSKLAVAARLSSTEPVDIICSFMNDVVVKLSSDVADKMERSSLRHASEKAIESYFHLFHLMLCLAIEHPTAVRTTNSKLQGMLNGLSSKNEIPNLGHLLIAILISDADMTKDLLMTIIRETVTRNVVWMLDSKGQGMAELVYMEANDISHYRLQKTFDASKTSYRLLMFQNLFRQTINRGVGASRKSLIQLRDELFDAHGAPPMGTAAKLAADIKSLQEVDSFPKFIRSMDLEPPTASQFTTFLRNCVVSSMKKGYSVWGVTQKRALTLRQQRDPTVQIREKPYPTWDSSGNAGVSFFPNQTSLHGRNGHH